MVKRYCTTLSTQKQSERKTIKQTRRQDKLSRATTPPDQPGLVLNLPVSRRSSPTLFRASMVCTTQWCAQLDRVQSHCAMLVQVRVPPYFRQKDRTRRPPRRVPLARVRWFSSSPLCPDWLAIPYLKRPQREHLMQYGNNTRSLVSLVLVLMLRTDPSVNTTKPLSQVVQDSAVAFALSVSSTITRPFKEHRVNSNFVASTRAGLATA
jgi:hypothetical protein